MAFPSPPPAPQRGDRTTFSNRVDAFLTWLTNLVPQMNTFLAGITSLAAGGANSFSYTFDAATADSSPGAGKIRLNSTTGNVSTVLRVAAGSGDGADVTMFMRAMQAGTSNIKSSVRLQKLGNVNAYLIFDITNVAEMTGYFNLTVAARVSTLASPFAANDTLALFFDPKGDRGDGGNTPTQAEMRAAIGTLPEANGGTGATTFAQARTNLGVLSSSQTVRLGAANNSQGTRFDSTVIANIANVDPAAFDLAAVSVTNGGNVNASAVISFYRIGGGFAAYFGLDIDNKWKVGGRSMGSVAYEIYHQGNFNPSAFAQLSGAVFNGPVSAPTLTETSDERKKTNWRPLTDEQLDALAEMDLVGVFDWIDGSGSAVGASAQQIRAIVPWAVHEDAEGNLSVAYGGLAFAMAHGALRRSRRAAV